MKMKKWICVLAALMLVSTCALAEEYPISRSRGCLNPSKSTGLGETRLV